MVQGSHAPATNPNAHDEENEWLSWADFSNHMEACSEYLLTIQDGKKKALAPQCERMPIAQL